MKFNVGDKVRVVIYNNLSRNPVGFVGYIRVADYFSDCYRVSDSMDGPVGSINWHSGQYLELVGDK
jgi:hypothetical protein